MQLKRTHSQHGEHRKFNPGLAPPLPPLDNFDLVLQVFTHKSLRRQGSTPGDTSDNERLSILGRAILELSLTRYLFRKRPMLKASDISIQRELLLSGEMIHDWVEVYGLVKKLRCQPGLSNKISDDSQEIRSLFYAYVGGLLMNSGPEAVNAWIDCLLSQENLVEPESIMTDSPPNPTVQKRMKSEPMSPPRMSSPARSIPSQTQASNTFYAFKPQQTPPHLPAPSRTSLQMPHATPPSSILPNPLAPAVPHAAFLPLFNEAAMKRRVTVEYLAEFSGPPHAGRWTVKCIVNGICKGEGSSSHKQSAKEEAARSAYYAMGWQ